MDKVKYLERLVEIVRLVRKKGVTFKEIESIGNGFSIRTFQRDVKDIEELWGLKISYNKSEMVYEINEESCLGKFEKIAESLNIVSALNKAEKVSQFIYLEQRKGLGTEYFRDILNAITDNVVIRFKLNSYWSEPSQRRCVPKAIKEAQNRWYLVAYDLDKGDFRNFGFDRISNLEITSGKMESPNINVKEYYKDAFGIENHGQPHKVILRLNNFQKNYLKSLPLHSSQKITNENENDFTVELYVHTTFDFKMEILKLGSLCEVIEPKHLRNEIIEEVKKLKNIYKN
jgi:predicted DNA-binding transcriptional regulator YafY